MNFLRAITWVVLFSFVNQPLMAIALDAARPYDTEMISKYPAYLRETRAVVNTVSPTNVVHKSGDETVAGAKTFTSPIIGNLNGNASSATVASDPDAIKVTGDQSIDGLKTFTTPPKGIQTCYSSASGKVCSDSIVATEIIGARVEKIGEISTITVTPASVGAIGKTGDDTIAGNKTFTGFGNYSGGAIRGPIQMKGPIYDIMHPSFGAQSINGYDNQPAIQATIDTVYAIGGGTVLIPKGYFQVGAAVKIKPGVNIVGVGNKDQGSSGIAALPSYHGPVLINDDATGTVIGTGEDGQSQRVYNSLIQGVAFYNTKNGTLEDDAVKLHNAWTITFRDSRFIAYSGMALRLIDCNVLHFENNFTAGGTFADSLADSVFAFNQLGPADQPSVDGGPWASTLWISGSGAWKNIIANNFIYNGPIGWTQTLVASGGAQAIGATGHTLIEGVPVTLETTGAFPSGLNGNTTYWVHVVDASNVKLATSRVNLLGSGFVTPSTAGTGTLQLRLGGKGTLYLNNGANRNTVSLNRFDQGYWSGFAGRFIQGNTFVGNTIHENGRANATGQPGFALYYSTNNTLSGNIADGTVTTTPYGVPNQTTGFLIDSNSATNKMNGNVSINHSTANYADTSPSSVYIDKHQHAVFLPAIGMQAKTGTATVTLLPSGRRSALSFPTGVDTAVTQWAYLEPGTYTPQIQGTNLGAGTGTGYFSLAWQEFSAGDDATVNEASINAIQVTASTVGIAVKGDLPTITVSTGGMFEISLKRIGTDSRDTITNAFGLFGVKFTPVFLPQ